MIAARDGDLARVIELLAANPGHKVAKLDLANKFGWRAIHFAAQNGNVEILNALHVAGAGINIKTLKTSTPLAVAIFHRKPATALRLIELGADLNTETETTKPRSLAFGMQKLEDNREHIEWDIATALVRVGVDLEGFNFIGGNGRRFTSQISLILSVLVNNGYVFHYLYDNNPPPQKVIDLVTALIERHTIDMVRHFNRAPDYGLVGRVVYITDILAQKISVASMRLLLDNGMQLVFEGRVIGDEFIPRQPNNQNPILKARQGLYSPEMNALIMERFPAPAPVVAPAAAPVAAAPAPAAAVPAQPPKMWKGWTRADLDRFNSVFFENPNNMSVCPVCFKYTERDNGCMYMSHRCLEEQQRHGGFVHKELYEKYKMVSADPYFNNKIEWCTICGRICKSHSHYELLPPFVANPKLIYINPENNDIPDPFGNECRGAWGGGGLPEKVARYRRAREFALELQGQIDQITEEEAMKQIIEEMWVAPIARYERRVQKILEERKYNIPNTNFPADVAPAPAAANAHANVPAPNVQRPQANRNDPALRPTVIEAPELTDVLTLDDILKGIKFHHRKPDGTIYHHEAPIGRPGFIAWFGPDGQDIARSFAIEEFGHCYERDCNAIWYPQELEPFVDTAEEEKFIPRDLFETYRQNFNRHMPARLAQAPAQGGYRRKHKTRKVKGNKRKQRGGQPHNMFLELETAQCLLPRKNKANTGGARKKHRKTKRKNRR